MTEFLKTRWQGLSASARVIVLCAVMIITLYVLIMLPRGGSAQEATPQQVPVQEELLPSDAQSFLPGDGLTNPYEMYVRWGDETFTKGDEYETTAWPTWAIGAYRAGGTWSTNNERSYWHVAATATNAAYLSLAVNRQILTNNAILELALFDSTNAAVFVDLFDTNETVIAEDLFGNLLTGNNADTTIYLYIPFKTYPEAVGINIRRKTGECAIYESLLFIDQDHDGSDADQEAQLGTSGRFSNVGSAPAVRMPREAATQVSPSSDGMSSPLDNPATTNAPRRGRTVYTDWQNGDDACDGLSVSRDRERGPKRTVKEALKACVSGDVLEIKAGTSEVGW